MRIIHIVAIWSQRVREGLTISFWHFGSGLSTSAIAKHSGKNKQTNKHPTKTNQPAQYSLIRKLQTPSKTNRRILGKPKDVTLKISLWSEPTSPDCSEKQGFSVWRSAHHSKKKASPCRNWQSIPQGGSGAPTTRPGPRQQRQGTALAGSSLGSGPPSAIRPGSD